MSDNSLAGNIDTLVSERPSRNSSLRYCRRYMNVNLHSQTSVKFQPVISFNLG